MMLAGCFVWCSESVFRECRTIGCEVARLDCTGGIGGRGGIDSKIQPEATCLWKHGSLSQLTRMDLVLQPLVAGSKIRHVYRRLHTSAITVQTLAEGPSTSCVVPAAPHVTPAVTGMVPSPSVGIGKGK